MAKRRRRESTGFHKTCRRASAGYPDGIQGTKSIAPRALPLGSPHAHGGHSGPHRGGGSGRPSDRSKGPRRRRLPHGGPPPGLPPAQRARPRLLDRPSGSVEPALPPALRPQAPGSSQPSGELQGPLEVDHGAGGGDLPEFFFPPDAAYLVQEPHRTRLRSVLEAEVSSPTLRGRSPEARILFQQDLWNRFDALHALAAKDSRAMPLARLLARLMARVALTKDELAGMRLSFAEAAQERLDVLDPRLFEAG